MPVVLYRGAAPVGAAAAAAQASVVRAQPMPAQPPAYPPGPAYPPQSATAAPPDYGSLYPSSGPQPSAPPPLAPSAPPMEYKPDANALTSPVPVSAAAYPVPLDTTGDGFIDSLGYDTTGDGAVDVVVPAVPPPQ